MRTLLAVVAAASVLVAGIAAQTPVASPAGPVFDVVSIKRSPPIQPGSPPSFGTNLRPDGGFIMRRVPAASLIAGAYPSLRMRPADIVGLPDWATREFFEVSTTSPLTRATPDDRAAMMRAMLVDRFKLVAHVEQRPQQVFELVLARGDRRLGKGLTAIEADCPAQVAARRAAVEAARNEGRTPDLPPMDVTKPPAPCTMRSVSTGRPTVRDGAMVLPPARLEGEAAMADLAMVLQLEAGRPVVDKTGLPGSYRIAVEFDQMATRRPPDVAPPAESGPSVFTAIQEQLGLKLQPATDVRDTLIVDRLERPTDN